MKGKIKKRGTLPAAIMLAAFLLSACAEMMPQEGKLPKTDENALETEYQAEPQTVLPVKYDYREEGRAVQVKNQGDLGTCWAFAAMMALETSLLPEEDWDFSEDHMSMQNSFGFTQEEGGDYLKAMAYLLAWQGPVTEEQDVYGDGQSPDGLDPVKHVQEAQILQEKDYQAIKEAVYHHGGVQSALYMDMEMGDDQSVFYNEETVSYYYNGTQRPNHDIVIVGWDDEFPKENFIMEPQGDGAFLCMNSWGEEFGQNGFFYVSYFDENIGTTNVVYSKIESPEHYDDIYHTDLRGWQGQLGYGQDTAYFANVYTSRQKEKLEAVGFYATLPDTEYQIYAAQNVDLSPDFANMVPVAEGGFSQAGFYTVPVKEEILLEPGERFAVIVKIRTPGAARPVAIEGNFSEEKSKVDLPMGEGYISPQGTLWERTETNQNCSLCLKAYTSRIDGRQ